MQTEMDSNYQTNKMIRTKSSSSSARSSLLQQRYLKEAEVEEDEFKRKPVWLDSFLKRTFFAGCGIHNQLRRNELNKYCVSCDDSACQYCVTLGPHKNHRLLKIYRHVYKDVVSLCSMEKYMDCTNIQPYKSNKRLIIALNPLPHCGLPINSDKRNCTVCNRRLNEVNCHFYCSMACKVKAFPQVLGGTGGDMDDSDGMEEEDDEEEEEVEEEEEKEETTSGSSTNGVMKKMGDGDKQGRKRKGIPQRAPMF